MILFHSELEENSTLNDEVWKAAGLPGNGAFSLDHFSYNNSALLDVILRHVRETRFNGITVSTPDRQRVPGRGRWIMGRKGKDGRLVPVMMISPLFHRVMCHLVQIIFEMRVGCRFISTDAMASFNYNVISHSKLCSAFQHQVCSSGSKCTITMHSSCI